MKKMIFTALVAMMAVVAASAQPRAIGIRGGLGWELSYQHSLGNNMIDGEVGFFHNGLDVSATYDWIFNITSGKGELNWYPGVGAAVVVNSDWLAVGVAGRIGLEYNFWFPLQLSLDYRPIIGLYDGGFGGVYDGVALGIRYKF